MIEYEQSNLNRMGLWKMWKEEGKTEAKKNLIEQYMSLVDFVVNRVSVGLPKNVSKEDLYSYGIMGLIDAVDKFDHERGLRFETYGSWRIRGAIIDGLRQGDWVPRSVREKSKKIEEAYQTLEQQYLRSVTDAEICEYLQMNEKEFYHILQEVSVATISSFDDPINDEESESRLSILVDSNAKNPEDKVNEFFMKESLAKAIERLTEKERTVISLFYYEELSLSEIADIMCLSPSRISQIHSKAILRLRGSLNRLKSQLMLDV